jgi:hypothetical protein
MANPIVFLLLGIVGGLIGASIYEGFRFEGGITWDGRYTPIIDTDGEFIDEFR